VREKEGEGILTIFNKGLWGREPSGWREGACKQQKKEYGGFGKKEKTQKEIIRNFKKT